MFPVDGLLKEKALNTRGYWYRVRLEMESLESIIDN